jgi:hypothetical protein
MLESKIFMAELEVFPIFATSKNLKTHKIPQYGKYHTTLYRVNTYALTEDNNAVDESVIEPSIFLGHGSQEDDSQRHKHQSS